MSFSVGDRLGRFQILGPLGAGGMGEVYRARDPQLQRDVAIKVLPAEFSKDAERRRRFEQEARAASSLNHPNILAVYDVGLERDLSYIVTELLDGETLGERMGGRPLPPRKAVEYALQIASGLAAAHDRGVAHRDIKPGNLFVTTDGRIKILDFGLAKLIGPDSSGTTETVIVDGTRPTTVLGTVAYMSPEQARGLRVDHRTDVFSFGVVLYEMLAGFPPFRRATSADTLNAILHDDAPDLPRTESAIFALERITRHCLEKKPEERFQSFRDLAFQLERPTEMGTAPAPAARRSRARRVLVPAIALLALAGAAAAGALLINRPSGPDPMAHRLRLMTDFVGLEGFSSISPDGKMLAFTAGQGGKSQIFIRYLAGKQALQVTTDDADHQLPRWSPDGSSLVYFSPAASGEIQGAIFKIPALGGPMQRVIGSIGGGDVSNTGRLAAFRLEKERIQLITSTLENAETTVVAELETRYYRYPRWSPDNQWIAFQAGDGFRWDVYLVPAEGGSPPVALTHDNDIIRGLTWRSDSRAIIYASSRGTTVPYLPPLALWEVLVRGGEDPHQLTPAEASFEQPDVHASGLISATRLQMRFDIWQYSFESGAAGKLRPGEQVTHQTGQVLTPTAAPDGNQIAYLSDSGGHANLWVTSAQRSPRQITFEDNPTVSIGVPIWSPDGRWIAFVSSEGNVGFGFGIWLVKPDGGEKHRLVAKGLGVAWSPDGGSLYFVETAPGPIKRIPVTGGEAITVRSEPARNIIGVDRSTVYYVVERALIDGRPEFHLRAAPLGDGPARTIQIIPASRVASWQIINPALSSDGKWMALPLTDGFTTNIWAVSTDDGRWQQVTDFGDRAVFVARRVSWSADGKSIIAAIAEGDADIVLLDGLIKGNPK